MRYIFVFLFLLTTFGVNAIEIDSAKRAEMIVEGCAELCNLIEYNSHVVSPADRKFVVVIDGDPNGINYVVEKPVGQQTGDIISQVAVDSINAELGRAYSQFGIEMYIIMMQSFDVVISTPLPAYPSPREVFQTKLFDQQSNITQLRAEHISITNEIISSTFSARNRDCIVYSRAEYSGTYAPGKIGHWSLGKTFSHRASPSTYPLLSELERYFFSRIDNNPALTGGYETSLREAAHQFYESAKFNALRAAILTTLTSQGMSAIFSQFNETVDYKALSEQERIHALAVFAGYPMHDNMITHEERYAVRIIENTPPDQVPMFLTDLSVNSPLQTNPNYQGFKPNEALICGLVREIDDAISGDGDNYTRLMRALITIELSNKDYAGARMPDTDQEWIDRRIYWDDWHLFDTPPIGTHDYDVALSGSGTVTVNKKVVDRLDFMALNNATGAVTYAENWDESYSPITLNPFDLVVFTNRSSLGMLQVAGAAPDQPFLAPAIFLKYADDKAFNTNAITVTALVLDMAAIASGPFAIASALRAGNVALAIFEGLQFIGAEANLAANALASDQVKEAVGIFNIIVGVWGVARVGVAGAKYTVDYFTAAKAGDINPIPMSTANEYCTRYDAITNWSNVDAGMKEEMRRMREVLGKEVSVVSDALTLKTNRANWLDGLKAQYGPFDINNFHTNGIQPNSIPSSLYNEMLAEYPTALSAQDKTRFLDGLITSGSSTPIKREVREGEQLIKIVPSEQKVSAYTAYFMSLEEFKSLEGSVLIEQKLGLPLTSHSVSYDVYVITAIDDTKVFESTVATTIENGYSTTGGATQTLVIDRSKWSAPSFMKPLTPPLQP